MVNVYLIKEFIPPLEWSYRDVEVN